MVRPAREIALEALDWTELVRAGDLVAWGQAAAEPLPLTTSLMAAREAIGGFRAFVGIGWSSSTDPAHADHVSFSSYCGTGSNRRLGDALDILPIPYGALAPTLSCEAPVVLIHLAPGPDPHRFSFGPSRDYIADLIHKARLVVALVNDQAPATGLDELLPRSAIDVVVRTSSPLAVRPPARSGPVEQAIATKVIGLIEDGATLQIGLGAVPSAILQALRGHRDLGVHSGMIGDEVADLVEAGVVTNARKSVGRYQTVTGLLAGGPRLMAWADRNPGLALRPTSFTHDPAVLAALDHFVALNSAIEVDLSGQVNAEVADGRYVGAVGGAGVFLRGALASRGGVPIVALPAKARHGSRIVRRLSGPVSTARCDAGIIVTEHGIADLRGLGLKERHRQMINIAAPEHRAMLAEGPE